MNLVVASIRHTVHVVDRQADFGYVLSVCSCSLLEDLPYEIGRGDEVCLAVLCSDVSAKSDSPDT